MLFIAIDTNIFLHLFNPAENTDSHIDKLLGVLITSHYQLLVDSTRKIGNEYQQKIVPIIRNLDETKPQLPLLRFWMNMDIRHEVELDGTDALMVKIKSVMHEPDEHADRAFVYVACKEGAVLVSNDFFHIRDRRDEILKKTRKERASDADIQSSREAAVTFVNVEVQRD